MRTVVGLHSSLEAVLVRPKRVRRLRVRPGWQSIPELKKIVESLDRHGVRPEVLPLAALDKISRSHQGVALDLDAGPELDWQKLKGPGRHWIAALDGIEDPQNLGAILRTCWLMGVEGVLIPKSRSAPMTPTVAKVASGGAEHVPVEECSSLSAPIRELKDAGFWVYGLSEKSAKSLWSFTYPEKVVWVLGAEGQGIRSATLKEIDELVTIPQVADGPSYNASVALALALGETARQAQTQVQKS